MMSSFGFEDVRKVWIEEKRERNLTDLNEEFYAKAAAYVSELRREAERGDELRRDILRTELREVLRMIQEIYLLRVTKAMDETLRGRFPEPLLESERYAFDEIRQSLNKLHAEVVSTAVEGKAALPVTREKANAMIVIQSEMPQIVGDDLKSYGPFKPGEVVNLPKRSAELLVRRGLAKKIEVRE